MQWQWVNVSLERGLDSWDRWGYHAGSRLLGAWRACRLGRVSGVRIPPSPPAISSTIQLSGKDGSSSGVLSSEQYLNKDAGGLSSASAISPPRQSQQNQAQLAPDDNQGDATPPDSEQVLLLEYRLDVIGPTQFVVRCPECHKDWRWSFGCGIPYRWLTPGSSGVYATHDVFPHSIERCYHCQSLFSPVGVTYENWEPVRW